MYLCLTGGSCPPFLPPGSLALVWGRGEAGITLPPSAPFLFSFERSGRANPRASTSAQSLPSIYEESGPKG